MLTPVLLRLGNLLAADCWIAPAKRLPGGRVPRQKTRAHRLPALEPAEASAAPSPTRRPPARPALLPAHSSAVIANKSRVAMTDQPGSHGRSALSVRRNCHATAALRSE